MILTGSYGQKCFHIFALLFFITSCQKSCRQWHLDESYATCAIYNSGRLRLEPDQACSKLAVEIIRSSSGTKVYLNGYSLAFSGMPQDDSKSIIRLILNDKEYTFQAERLVGGQRLLLPDPAAELIINALLQGDSVHLIAGRYETDIVPDRFPQLFQSLNNISITPR